MTERDTPLCLHCRQPMLKWHVPDFTTWGCEFQYVCFNDECSYYVRGWQWMKERFNVTGSYRLRRDPRSGQQGPVPVWSANALRDGIIDSHNEGGE